MATDVPERVRNAALVGGVRPSVTALQHGGRGIDYACTTTEICCPACLNERGHVLYTVTSGESAQHFVLREAQPERHDTLRAHIETLWGGPSSRLVSCARCGFTFADPFVAGDQRFYDLAYERARYPAWRWEFGCTWDALEREHAAEYLRRLQLLEIGAGDGAFVRSLVPGRLTAENVLCTEFSRHGLRAIRTAGIRAIEGDVRTLEPDFDGHFDAVCMFQVVEHSDDLDGLFSRLAALTRPAASLFISVPNARRIEFNERHGALLDMPPNHIGRWTRAAFDAIAIRHGWRIVSHVVERENARSRAQAFATYVYFRRRQFPKTLENRVERLPRGPVRTGLQAVLVGSNVVRSARSLAELLLRRDLGGSQWVHLTRETQVTGA